MNGATNLFFNCTHCGIQLSVPTSMAGIAGPCPLCGNRIIAPLIPASNKINPSPRPSAIRPKSESSLFTDNPSPQGSQISPLVEPMPVSPLISAESTGLPIASATDLTGQANPAASATNGTHQYHPFTDAHTLLGDKKKRTPARAKKFTLSRKTLVMLSFVALTALSILAVLIYLKKEKAGRQIVKKPPSSTDPIAKPAAGGSGSIENILEGEGENDGNLSHQTGNKLGSMIPQSKSRLVEQMLDTFLKANDLDERKQLIQSNIPEETLRMTIFNKKWPIATFSPLAQVPFPDKRLLEYQYHVEFAVNAAGFPEDALLTVQQRGENPPKIDIDPLLDTIGGRLRDYAASHTIEKPDVLGMGDNGNSAPYYQKSSLKDAQDFFCIIHARPDCFSQDVPNREKKATIKLRAYDEGEDLAVAYTNKKSETYKLFEDQAKGIRWNAYITAQITLMWNVKEDTDRPFLEIIKIKTIGWNR